MSKKDIEGIVEAFGSAAVRAQRAGFDGVQIHAAHCYLLGQFLSPYYNKRRDEYGGSLENRARLVLEVLKTIRDRVGDHFPIVTKLNSEDYVEGGFTVEEMLQVAAMLENGGIDAVELSGGTFVGRVHPVRKGSMKSEEEEVYYREAAKRFKSKIGAPLMLVGGIRSYGVAERLVKEGVADYISLCRPLIREPNLINRWKSGETSRSKCESDSLCFGPALKGKGLYCVLEQKQSSR